MPYFAGVDLGATKIKVVVGDEGGQELATHRRTTPQGPTGIDVTESVLGAIRATCETAGITPAELRATGVGSFGPFDLAEGMIVRPANLPDSVNQIPIVGPIQQLIRSERVYLHNDTTAGVIGERFHSERNPDDMVYLTISTGIGAGITVDGHVLGGWDANAGEVGHFTVDPKGRLTCGCGIDGHWEAYASGSGIPRYAKWLAEEVPEGAETDLPLHRSDFTAADVFAQAETDPLAGIVIDRIAHWNQIGLANLIHAYAPLVVSIGGAVAIHNEAAVLDPLRERIDDLVMANVPRIQLTTLGDDVVVRGALASAMTGGTGDRSRLAR